MGEDSCGYFLRIAGFTLIQYKIFDHGLASFPGSWGNDLDITARYASAAHSAAAAQIAQDIGDTKLRTPTASDGVCSLVGVLLPLIPASAALETVDQKLILEIIGFKAERFLGMLQCDYVVADAGIGKRTVIEPACVPVSDPVEEVQSFPVMTAVDEVACGFHMKVFL